MSIHIEPIEEQKDADWGIPTKRDIEIELQQQDLTKIVEQCGLLIVDSDRKSREVRRRSQLHFESQQDLHHQDKQDASREARIWYIAAGCLTAGTSFASAFTGPVLTPMGLFSENAVKAGSAALTTVSRAGETTQHSIQNQGQQKQDYFDYLKTRSGEAARVRQEEVRSDNNQNIHSALNAIKEANQGKGQVVHSIFSAG
jgi:hypothetical protein